MISAADASQQSQQAMMDKHKDAMGKVENAVLLAVKQGKVDAEFYIPPEFPIDFVMTHLKLLGYRVRTSEPLYQRDGLSLLINWE